MKTKEHNIFQQCKSLDFGKIKLNDDEEKIYTLLTDQMIHLCKSLPSSMQNESLLFLMNYAGINLGQTLELFKNYYAPAWTIIYHMSESDISKVTLTSEEYEEVIKIQAMAMFLHSLDDHIVDGDITPSHQLLLLRSQAWVQMTEAITRFTENIPSGNAVVESMINNYYSGICTKTETNTIEEYCTLFRKQMATWVIVPVLTALKVSDNKLFAEDIQKAYQSFGIAWRLLDDVNDVEEDIRDGIHSSVYIALDQEGRKIWNNKNMDDIAQYISKNKVIEKLIEKICSELEISIKKADQYNMQDMADQYRTLIHPLKTWLK